MELYVSGVQVPKLGSLMDRTARSYLFKRVNKEVTINRLLAQIATGVGGDGNKEWSNTISGIWNNYLNLAYYTEDETEQRETDMQEEYAFWKTIKPKIIKDAKGKLTVTGLSKDRTK